MRNKSEKEMEALARVEPECTAMVRAETKLKRLNGKRRRRGGRRTMDLVSLAAMAYLAYMYAEDVGLRSGTEKAGL